MRKRFTSMIDEDATQFEAAVFGDAPLRSIASHFRSREELLRFYAGEIERMYRPQQHSCEFCGDAAAGRAGHCRFVWQGTVKVFWLKTIFACVIYLLSCWILVTSLLPYIGHFMGTMVKWLNDIWNSTHVNAEFNTYHPICGPCWKKLQARQRVMSGLQVVLVIAFVTCLGGIGLSSLFALGNLFGRHGPQFHGALKSGLITLALLTTNAVLLYSHQRVVRRLRVPRSHRSLVKAPFYLSGINRI